MLRLAVQMLLGDKLKYVTLLLALAFSTFLITQQLGIFAGLMRRSAATLSNFNIPIWVVDPNVEHVTGPKYMKDTDLSLVRSVPGVAWAVPLYYGRLQAKFMDGSILPVELFGLDDTTLIGSPSIMLEGNIKDLWKSHGVIVDQRGRRQTRLGETFDISDKEARVVGLCHLNQQSFFGDLVAYTTYQRAIEYSMKVRNPLAFILVQPKKGINHLELTREIKSKTGLGAYTQNDFFWSTIYWYCTHTGIPIAFATTVLIGIVVGMAVVGQTFYSFISENLGNLGALKAMGTSQKLLSKMLILQACVVGFIGYGIGVGFASLFGYYALLDVHVPFHLPYQIPFIVICMVLCICFFAAYIGIRKISRLETAEVFRA